MPDQLLYDNDINEEDKVIFDEDGLLRKPLGRDWTSYCNDKNTDIAGFVNWMQRQSQEGDTESLSVLRRERRGDIKQGRSYSDRMRFV